MSNTTTRHKKPGIPTPAMREYLWMKQIGKSLSANTPLRPNKRTKTSEGDKNSLENRHRFLTAYKRRKLQEKSVLGGSLYEDAKLYKMSLRQDTELYEELYGISPFHVPKMHSETRALLNDHATVLASGNYRFTPIFQQAFAEFVYALRAAKSPPYDYFRRKYNGDIGDEHPLLMKLRSRHWALERAFKKSNTLVAEINVA
ncbi:hypothetical protein BDV39DRAFT_201348 [Aspergillus sergii]|uniref:Uncharacterized protein n=1 Tax=Aspergillus sergii TaxID=1034303 RepID=A0A5N6XD72_9EURO|nr:hypothetical protein BDV39DRAFT_201348 [Aspergillus sergii]